MNELGNTVEDLFLAEELKEYTTRVYPFNLDILHMALKAKLEEEPDYEVWVPLIYYKCLQYVKKGDSNLVLSPYKIFISNKGRIGSLRGIRGKPVLIIKQGLSGGYATVNLLVGKVQEGFLIHRALGCCFIPVPDTLAMHPKDLQINHMDGVKLNVDLGNLEWCTPLGNTTHAHVTGLMPKNKGLDNEKTIPLKGVVLVGEFKGYEFIIAGGKECIGYGLLPAAIRQCYLGVIKKHCNCQWSIATKDEVEQLPRGIPDEILASIKTFNPRIKTSILATEIATGKTLTITGGLQEMLSLGFVQSGVSAVLTGKNKSHKGYTFKPV